MNDAGVSVTAQNNHSSASVLYAEKPNWCDCSPSATDIAVVDSHRRVLDIAWAALTVYALQITRSR